MKQQRNFKMHLQTKRSIYASKTKFSGLIPGSYGESFD